MQRRQSVFLRAIKEPAAPQKRKKIRGKFNTGSSSRRRINGEKTGKIGVREKTFLSAEVSENKAALHKIPAGITAVCLLGGSFLRMSSLVKMREAALEL
ncbi:MAG: hypothetical protein ACTTKL_10925 [Treponema sp.]